MTFSLFHGIGYIIGLWKTAADVIWDQNQGKGLKINY